MSLIEPSPLAGCCVRTNPVQPPWHPTASNHPRRCRWRGRVSRSPGAAAGERRQGGVSREQHQPLDFCLGGQHAIEGIAVGLG